MPNSGNDLKRRQLLNCLGAGSAAMLAGCSSLGTNNGSGGSKGGAPKQVVFWTGYFEEPGVEEWAKWYKNSYKKKFGPSVKIGSLSYEQRREKMLVGAKSGQPDFIEANWSIFTDTVHADLLEPITDRVESLNYWDDYLEPIKDAMKFEGEIYGLPANGSGRGLIYRKDIFEKHGLSPPKTFADFYEVAYTIKENEDGLWPFHNCTSKSGVRAFQEWSSHVYQMVDQLYLIEDGKAKLNPKATAEMFGRIFNQFYYKPYNKNPIINPDEKGTGWKSNDPAYINGNVAMIEVGPWIRSWYSGDNINNSSKAKKILNEKSAVTSLMSIEGAKNPKATFMQVNPVLINKHSKNKDYAWKGVKHFTSPKSFKQLKKANPKNSAITTPVMKTIDSTFNETYKPFVEIFRNSTAPQKISWGPVMEAFYEEQQPVVYGEKKPHTAGKDLRKKLIEIESKLTG